MKAQFIARAKQIHNEKKNMALVAEGIFLEVDRNDDFILPLEKGKEYRILIEEI